MLRKPKTDLLFLGAVTGGSGEVMEDLLTKERRGDWDNGKGRRLGI